MKHSLNNFCCGSSGSIPCACAEKFGERCAANHSVGSYLVEFFGAEEVGYGHTAPCCETLHGYHGGIAVAADYKAFNLVGVGVESFAQVVFEAAAVKSATHAYDAVLGQTGDAVDKISHRIHRVRYAYYHSVGACFEHALGYLLNDACIYADEFFARHSRFAGYARSNNYYVTVGCGCVIIGYAFDAGVHIYQIGRLHHVHCFTFAYTLFDVNHHYFVSDAAKCYHIGCRCSYVAGSNNCYF